ncbi:BQ2448_5419 [Microbotryum intermedium]|uniref:BQ2448_5419 protein n=1 Tax=Microbotryum intermedium TaxID=269621 RepID=A0A238F9F0_9BASI|nr:BQ2448_5419 [Microbotryum intermedium]
MHLHVLNQCTTRSVFRLSAYFFLLQTTAVSTLATAAGVLKVKTTMASSKSQYLTMTGTLDVQHFLDHKAVVQNKYRHNRDVANEANRKASTTGMTFSMANPHLRRDLNALNVVGFHDEKLYIESKYSNNMHVATAKPATDFVFKKVSALTRRGQRKVDRSLPEVDGTHGENAVLSKRGGASSATVPLGGFKQQSGNFYDLKVSIGSLNEEFSVVFDTASAELWVPNKTCNTNHKRLSGDSSSLYVSGLSWSTYYWPKLSASDSTIGTIDRDSVQMAGLTVKQQIFIVVSKISAGLERLPTDGVMGFAFSTMATGKMPTFFENLIHANAIEAPLIAFSLDYHSPTGELVIGGTDDSKFQPASMQFYPVTAQGYWQILCDGIVVDGKLVQGTSMNTAIDTGTALMLIPIDTAKSLFKSIDGAFESENLGWMVPCQASIKTIGLSFGGTLYNVPLSELILGSKCWPKNPEDPTQCKLAIASSSNTDLDSKPVAIIGSAFLHTVYTVLTYKDQKNNQPAVGFAPILGSGASGVSPPPITTPAPGVSSAHNQTLTSATSQTASAPPSVPPKTQTPATSPPTTTPVNGTGAPQGAGSANSPTTPVVGTSGGGSGGGAGAGGAGAAPGPTDSPAPNIPAPPVTSPASQG